MRLNVYLAMILLMGFGTHTIKAMQYEKIIQGLRQTKLSIEQVVLSEFGQTLEAATSQGKDLIFLQRQRIRILDEAIQAVEQRDELASMRYRLEYMSLGCEITLLEKQLQFFVDRE